MTSLASRITARTAAPAHAGRVWTPHDFLHLGSRAAVDQALSRLVMARKLRRIGRGLYDRPRVSAVLKRPILPTPKALADAISRRDRIAILPDGIFAANRLGLTTAVPARNDYVTNGRSRTVTAGDLKIHLRHAGKKIMQLADSPCGPVVQALDWIGAQTPGDMIIVGNILRRRLPENVKRDLARQMGKLPDRLVPVARLVIERTEA